jgi:hypothetical protein
MILETLHDTAADTLKGMYKSFLRLPIGLLIVLSAFNNAAASEVTQAEITFVGNAYHYQFSVEIQAPIEAVREVVTDYDNLKRINNDVIQSEVLERYDAHRIKRRLWLNHCVFVFCFDLYFVEDIEHFEDGTITTTVIPAESNFRRGHSTWRIESVSEAVTRISVDAEQEPDFWIPPVIGPIIFRRAFTKEVRETAVKIEREAQRVQPQ